MSCIFCKIIKGESHAYKVYEDDLTLSFLDINPISHGHILVITKRHEPRLENLPREHSDALFQTVRKLVGPIQKAAGAPSANIGINNGREAGQIIQHIHVHIIPRDGSKPAWRKDLTRMPKSSGYFEDTAEKIRGIIGP
ncbi:HIT domain-containing protein|nr:HIT domain-containing protein [Candidatus Bathyarchaeota archaeon]